MASEAEAAGAGAGPPAWLNAAFVQEALRNGGDADAQVDALEVEAALGVGDNYCSSLFRVRARVRGGLTPAWLLVKALPAGDQWTYLVHEARLFDREMIAFSRVLPAVEALLRSAAPGELPPFAAKCYRQSREPELCIVLEDLKPRGFRMVDRRVGLDLPHALAALRALGRLHGASAALWGRRPALFDGLVSMFDDAGADLCADYFDKAMETTARTIDSWTDFPGNYGQKVNKLRKNIIQKLREVNRVRPGKLNVLIHGDYWVNNFLFRYQNEQVQEIRMVDFQLSHVGNPAIDLILFLHTSLAEEVFDGHWGDLLAAYHGALAETMHLLGQQAPSLQDIRQDMHEARVYALLAALVWIPSTRLEEGKVDLDKVIAEDKKIHRSPLVRHWLQKLLPILDAKGLLDE